MVDGTNTRNSQRMRKRDKDLETWQCTYLLVKGEYAYDRDFHKSVQAISKRIGVDIRTVRERLKTGHKNRFRGEFFNLLNEAHFRFPDGTINQPTAGVISSTVDSERQIQFGLKLIF